MNIKLVKQKHKKGCVPACLAMITGISYDNVIASFLNDFDKQGISSSDDSVISYIIEHGFMIERRKIYGYENIAVNNKILSKPFADVHLLFVQQFANRPKEHHAIVMLKSGKIL